MAMPSPTQRIQELQREADKLGGTVGRNEHVNAVEHRQFEERLGEFREAIAKLTEKIASLDVGLTELQSRVTALETSTNRSWQLAPMVISAVAVLISLLVAFLKK